MPFPGTGMEYDKWINLTSREPYNENSTSQASIAVAVELWSYNDNHRTETIIWQDGGLLKECVIN